MDATEPVPIAESSPEGAPEAAAVPMPVSPPKAPFPDASSEKKSNAVVDLLTWSDAKKSAGLLVAVNAVAYFTWGFSFLSLLCWVGILQIILMRVALLLEAHAGLKVLQPLTKIPVPSKESFSKIADVVTAHVVQASEAYEGLVTTDDLATLGGLLFGLFVASYVVDLFNPALTAYVGFNLAMVLTPLYAKNKAKCDELGGKAFTVVNEKVVVPGMKKFEEVSEKAKVATAPYKEKVMGLMGKAVTAKEE